MPKNRHEQRKPLYFENTGSTSSSKIEVRKKVFYKKWSPKLIFLNDFFFEKILLIFDIENWLWKYNFGTFWQTDAPRTFKIQWFPLSMSILGQKAYILGPTIFEIPQPNWYYYVRYGEIQGCSLVFCKAHCPCILPCLT